MISKILLVISLVFASIQLGASEVSERCELKTNQPDLLKPMNKSVICEEVFRALYPTEVKEYDYFLRIEANGFRRMYSVELTKIEGFIGSDRTENTSGVLYWNPDGSDVVLD